MNTTNFIGGCRASIAESLERLATYCTAAARLVLDLSPANACPCAGMWIKMVQLPCWPPRDQQVSHERWSRCRTRGEYEEFIAHRRQRVYKPSKRLPELRKVTSTEKSLQNFPLTAICFCLICMHYISPSRLLLEDIIPLANPTGTLSG